MWDQHGSSMSTTMVHRACMCHWDKITTITCAKTMHVHMSDAQQKVHLVRCRKDITVSARLQQTSLISLKHQDLSIDELAMA